MANGVGSRPDCQRRVITMPLGRRLGVVSSIGGDRFDPMAAQGLGFGHREPSAGGEGQGMGRAHDLDRAACRLDPVDANSPSRFQQQPGSLERRDRRLRPCRDHNPR